MTRVDDAVRKRFRAGEPLDLRGTRGGALPELRADTLAELLTEDRAARRAVPAAWLAGVRIVGELRLAGAMVSTPLWLTACEFDEAPDLEMAHLEGLSLLDCRLPGLNGANLRVAANLRLTGLVSDGTVRLNDAQVGGTLRLDRATLRVPGGYALFGERLEVRGALYARQMRTEGEIRIPGARVIGNVNLGGSRLVNSGGDTLDANGIDVSGTFLADRFGRRASVVSSDPEDRFVSEGRMLLAGARISGDLVLSGAQIRRELPVLGPERPPGDDGSVADGGAEDRADTVEQSMRLVPRGIIDAAACLVADRIRVEGNLELDDGFHSSGTVRLPNAAVGGYVRLSGAELGYAEGVPEGAPASTAVALLGDGMEIGGDLECRNDGVGALRVTGQLRLAGARVRGSASLSRIELNAPGGDALFADALTVGSMLFLRKARFTGTVRLQGARIGSSLDCSGAQLVRPRLRPDGSAKPSLDLRAATIGKDLFCNDGFRAEGGVRLRSAEVLKSVVISDVSVGADGRPEQFAFNGYGLVTPELTLRPSSAPPGRVRLSKAVVGSFTDNEELWQAAGGLELEGFEFQSLGTEIDVATRLGWLTRALPVYAPGPYEQLAAAYRGDGEEEKAERVQMVRQRRRYASLGVAGRVWGELQRWTVGFGYRPWLAVCWLSLFWVLGGVWFTGHPLTPIDSGQNPVWNPWLYAADTLIPIINLGADGYWRAQGASQWISSSLVVVGWILASTAASGAARVLKRS
ncbi:hypothetical protein [Pseudonocardia spinosispora]|uniref:hypothetical protein n=1 Tax=Pseudonocardia spinosispora TaxID=103441 RepID=UPI00048B41BB|nr:hypothetical protein [Pseudonocardia spinosispora]